MTATLALTSVTLPSAPVGAPNPLPAVAAMPQAPYEASVDGLPDDIAENIRYGQVTSIHPYLLQDEYTRERTPTPMRVAVLENDLMRAEFAVELGGRLVRLLDKATGRDLVYRNAMFQPANLALRGAWFSGGVEWNIGMRGHWPLTCDPMYAASLIAPDGEPVLRMWEYERVRGLIVQIDATLDSAVAALHVRVRVRNPHADETGMYWWTNIAVAQTAGSRVFAPATHAYQTQYDGTLGRVDVASPDVSRPAEARAAADWFYSLEGSVVPWIAALEPDGSGLGHVSSPRLSGRKLFVWGETTGGRHWQEWLGGRTGAYFEIQGGLATTQYEHLRMPGGATWEWSETFLPLQVDGDVDGAWASAVEVVGAQLRTAAGATDASRLDAVADVAPERLLNVGSPWGALEAVLAERYGEAFESLPGVRFDATAGEDAAYWRRLLGLSEADARAGSDAGAIDADGDDSDLDAGAPPASYVAGPLWDRLLAEAPASWLTHHHRGVMAHARGDLAGAKAAYEASLRLRRTAWALRGLGLVDIAGGETDAGIAALADALSLAPDLAPLALELGEALLTAERAEEASGLIASLPAEVRERGRFRVLAVRAALASGARDDAGRMLEAEFDVPDIREGELSMSALWQQAFPDRPVPARYDFSMT
ncbi:DUF5107 domain-containing protein [Microbacterium esteraromaticum]|uniref:DUF5107 domain-containing protein n=1 Tax=Microbacterium esteraromaticum TaxID=57043 RepID=A0A7D8AAC6_9MICO|nr:DUF5107 domain-containing protein [Microbacterium esteraromaticum]QMU96861.1 DUF5107 domain-containing protein [Microbacterium esteraromaticum]